MIFAGLISLMENVQNSIQFNFCDQRSISFILKSFLSISVDMVKSLPQDFIKITLVSSLSLTLKSNDCQNQSSKNYVLKKVWTKPTAAAQTIEIFLCELGMKPHLVEISILSISLCIRPTKIIKRDNKNMAHFLKIKHFEN